MENLRACNRCDYWVSVWATKERSMLLKERRSKRGECHRHAPRSSALSLEWPKTKGEDWCGDFEEWKQERRKPKSDQPPDDEDRVTQRV